MIHINRQKVKVPSVFVGEESPAASELKKITAFIQEQQQLAVLAAPEEPPTEGKKKKKKSFDFDVYSRNEVKDALAQLFHGKCAYCETRYAPTQPVDVEHFRPKAGVDDDPTHPGYYWLAASWENLLPSCIDCNRERTQEISSETGTGDGETKTRKLKLGKGNRFPLVPGSHRNKLPEDAAGESPLLLDPCRDYPEKELEFTDDGIVRPKASGEVSGEMARTSIEVYGLNRTGLVLNRLEVLRLVQGRMYTIDCLADILDREEDSDIRGLLEDLLSHEMAELERLRDEERPYALMCRQVIDRFVADLTGVALEAWKEVE